MSVCDFYQVLGKRHTTSGIHSPGRDYLERPFLCKSKKPNRYVRQSPANMPLLLVMSIRVSKEARGLDLVCPIALPIYLR